MYSIRWIGFRLWILNIFFLNIGIVLLDKLYLNVKKKYDKWSDGMYV